MLSRPLTVIDTFGESKNKVQIFSVIQPLIGGKLFPAAGAHMPCEHMMSHDDVTSSLHPPEPDRHLRVASN